MWSVVICLIGGLIIELLEDNLKDMQTNILELHTSGFDVNLNMALHISGFDVNVNMTCERFWLLRACHKYLMYRSCVVVIVVFIIIFVDGFIRNRNRARQ